LKGKRTLLLLKKTYLKKQQKYHKKLIEQISDKIVSSDNFDSLKSQVEELTAMKEMLESKVDTESPDPPGFK
jgi:hypothetical protein